MKLNDKCFRQMPWASNFLLGKQSVVISTLGVDSTYVRGFFCTHGMWGFFGAQCMANGIQIWQNCTNLSLKFGVLIVGEIEQQ